MSDDANGNTADERLDSLPQIELRVPGPWNEPADLQAALEKADSQYRLDERGLVHVSTGEHFACSATPHDDEIAAIFADTGRLSRKELAATADHRTKVHLSGPGGSPEAARRMMHAATALLHAGGTGVLVDNSALPHSKKDWLKLAEDKGPGGVYWAHVIITGDDELLWSAGMHCLGFRDAELPDPPGRELGGFLMHNFLGYVYQSGVAVLDGELIGGDAGPAYRVRHVPCTRFETGTPFHNPYGVWRWERTDEK